MCVCVYVCMCVCVCSVHTLVWSNVHEHACIFECVCVIVCVCVCYIDTCVFTHLHDCMWTQMYLEIQVQRSNIKL